MPLVNFKAFRLDAAKIYELITGLRIATSQERREQFSEECSRQLDKLKAITASKLMLPPTIHDSKKERSEWERLARDCMGLIVRGLAELLEWNRDILPPIALAMHDEQRYYAERASSSPEHSKRQGKLLGLLSGLKKVERFVQEVQLPDISPEFAKTLLDILEEGFCVANDRIVDHSDEDVLDQYVRLVHDAEKRLTTLQTPPNFWTPGGDTRTWMLQLRTDATDWLVALVNISKDRFNRQLFQDAERASRAVWEKRKQLIHLEKSDVTTPSKCQTSASSDDSSGQSPTIIRHGERRYSIGEQDPVTVTEDQDTVLTAFCEENPLDTQMLVRRSGLAAERAVKALTKLSTIFPSAIRRPGKRNNGGYYVRIRAAE